MDRSKVYSLENLHVARAINYCKMRFVWCHTCVDDQHVEFFLHTMTERKDITAHVVLDVKHTLFIFKLGNLVHQKPKLGV